MRHLVYCFVKAWPFRIRILKFAFECTSEFWPESKDLQCWVPLMLSKAFWNQECSIKICIVTIMCRNDKLSLTLSWVSCLLKDSELFTLFAENSQILLKIAVIPILLKFIYLVSVSKQPTQLIVQLNSSLRDIIATLTARTCR